MTEQRELPPIAIPTATHLSFMLWILSLQLTAAIFLGHLLFGHGWFGPLREVTAFAISMALTVYHGLWGRARIRQYHQIAKERQPVMTIGQALVVVFLILLAAVFGTWLFGHE